MDENRRNPTKTEEDALRILSSLCAKGEHCSGEIVRKIRLWNIGEEGEARIMSSLGQKGFIDDKRYCRAFIADKLEFGKWGKRKIAYILKGKGIDESVIGEALSEVDDSRFADVLEQLIESKRRSCRSVYDDKEEAKIIRFALSRGFDINSIMKCLRR